MGRYPPQLKNQEEDVSTLPSLPPLSNKSPVVTTTRSRRSVQRSTDIVKDYMYIAAIQQWYGNAGRAIWRPIGWHSRKTHVTKDVGVHACVKMFTTGQMISLMYARLVFNDHS